MADIYVSGSNTLSSNIFTDGEFTSADGSAWSLDSGWSYDATNNRLVATATTGSAKQSIDLTDNVMHRVIFGIHSFTSGSFSLLVGGTPPDINSFLFNTSGIVPQEYLTDQTSSTLVASLGINAGNALTAEFNYIRAYEYQTSGSGTEGSPFIGPVNNDYSSLSAGDTLFLSGDIADNKLVLENLSGTASNPIRIVGTSSLNWTIGGSDYQNAGGYAIYLNNCEHISIENITVTGNCDLWSEMVALNSGTEETAIKIYEDCHNIQISNCHVRKVGQGIRISNATNEGITTINTNVHVNNSSFYYCKARAISMNANYGSVRNCKMTLCGYEGWSDASAMVIQGGGCTIENNLLDACGHNSEDADSQMSIDGYSLDNSNHGLPTYVRGNVFLNTYACPVTAYYGTDLYFYNNIIDGYNKTTYAGSPTSGKLSAIRLGATNTAGTTNDSFRVYNNLFMNDGEGNAATAAITFGFGHIGIDTLEIKNNIFIDCSQFFLINDTVTITGALIDNNLYYLTSGDYTNHWNMVNVGADGNNYDSFSAWQGSSLSPDANGLNEDAILDDSYYPASTSPCLNAGTIPLSPYDAYSRPNWGNHIGAVWPKINTSKKRRSF